jgi:pimeloyl-ACP methyl ester carboxylesterase
MNFRDYPSNSSAYFTVNNLKMHYLEGGKDNDETLVMIHGNPSWSFYYRNLFNTLVDKYHCIVPDHIGMGLSDKPGDAEYSFTLKERVDNLEALLDATTSNKDLTLIVHDWGGMIGLAYATRYPDRIKRLIISNTAGFHIPEGKQVPWELKLTRTPVIGALLNQGFNAFPKGAVSKCVTRKPMSKEVGQAYIAPYDSWANRLSVLRFVEDIPLDKNHVSYDVVDDVDKNLEKFKTLPVLICWGLKDFVFDNDFLAEWKRRLPDAEYHEYDAGHYLLEDAGDEVIPVMQQFLAKNPIK